MKGQIRVSNIVIAFIILGFIMVGGFKLYVNFLVDNDVVPDTSMQTRINALYYTDADQVVKDTQNSSTELSTQFESGDNVYIRGSKPLDDIKSIGVLSYQAVKIAQNSTTEAQLPDEFFWTIGAIISVLVVLAIAGAAWKWDF